MLGSMGAKKHIVENTGRQLRLKSRAQSGEAVFKSDKRTDLKR